MGRQAGTRARGQAPARALAALVLCLGLVVLCVQSAAGSTGNEAKATFTDEATGLVYTITEAASSGDAGMVTLSDGTAYVQAELVVPETVSATFDGQTYEYAVTAVGNNAFKGNTALESVTFEGDLSGPWYSSTSTSGGGLAIGSAAFSGCAALAEVNFPQEVAGISSQAFYNCTALAEVNFPEGAELYTNSTSASAVVGASAFRNCSSLESITIPAITSTVRKPDSYYSYDDYNPGSNYLFASMTSAFTSGYMAYWHNGLGPIARPALAGNVFTGCTSLTTIVFEAGAGQGAFGLWDNGGAGLDTTGCPNLEAVIYESEQAYWGDPNRSMQNGTYYDVWLDSDDEDASASDAPTLYYAVDYYATLEDAQADDAAASNRLARVEYARGTPVASLAAGDAEALAAYAYEDATAYALTDADGTVPSAKEAAVVAGLDTAGSDTEWVWKLTGTQSRREGLTDSCSAYPVQADELSAGRLVTDASAALQTRCDQNLSRWLVDGQEQDSSFDVERWYTDSTYDFNTAATDADDDATDVWLTISSGGEDDLLGQLQVQRADGTVLATDACNISYEYYDEDAGELVQAASFVAAFSALGSSGGPLLVTIEADGCTGSLQEWVLVKGKAGSVLTRFTDSAAGSAGSWYAASAASEANKVSAAVYSSSFAVRVGSGDLASALVGVGYAGLEGAPINVAESDEEAYGFALSQSYNAKNGTITTTEGSSAEKSFGSEGDAAAFAVAAYEAFESDSNSSIRSSWGLEALKWGSTAVLVDQSALEDVAAAAAAYAYATQAHVFYLEEDGSVGEGTLACLADFETVVLFGTADTCDDVLVAALQEALPVASVDAGFVQEDRNAASLSLAVAECLLNAGLANTQVVAVVDGEDAFDAIGALNRAGLSGGIMLVANGSAEAKDVSLYLRACRDGVSTVRLFGRTGGNALDTGFDLAASLESIWDEYGNYEEPSVASGDTVELFGVRFCISGGSGSEEDPYLIGYETRLWGSAAVEAGVYEAAGRCYSLAETVTSDMGVGEDDDAEEDADGDAASAGAAGSSGSGSSAGSASAGSGSAGGASGSSGSGASGSASSGSSASGSSSSASSSGSASSKASALSLVSTGSSSSAASAAAGSGYVDAGWAVTNVGDVSAILASLAAAADDDAASTVYSASSTSGEDADVPYLVLVLVALSLLGLAFGLWLLLRRRGGEHYRGYDLV